MRIAGILNIAGGGCAYHVYVNTFPSENTVLITDMPKEALLIPIDRFGVLTKPAIAELKKSAFAVTSEDRFEVEDNSMRLHATIKIGEAKVEWNLNLKPDTDSVFVTNVPNHCLVLSAKRLPIKFLGLPAHVLQEFRAKDIRNFADLQDTDWEQSDEFSPQAKEEMRKALKKLEKMALIIPGRKEFEQGKMLASLGRELKDEATILAEISKRTESGANAKPGAPLNWLAQAQTLVDPPTASEMAEHLASQGLMKAQGGEK